MEPSCCHRWSSWTKEQPLENLWAPWPSPLVCLCLHRHPCTCIARKTPSCTRIAFSFDQIESDYSMEEWNRWIWRVSDGLAWNQPHSLLSAAITPVVPALRQDHVRNVAVNEDGSRVGTPSTTQVNWSIACDRAAHKWESCARVSSSLLCRQGSASWLGYGVQVTALHTVQVIIWWVQELILFEEHKEGCRSPEQQTNLVDWLSIATNKVDAACKAIQASLLFMIEIAYGRMDNWVWICTFDVAVFEVVTTFLVVERVLSTEKSAVEKRSFVTGDSKRHCLFSYSASGGSWSGVLHKITCQNQALENASFQMMKVRSKFVPWK